MIPIEVNRQKLQLQFDATHSQSERNSKGQFATPFNLAKAIAQDALSRVNIPAKVIEPSCGTGAFISALTSTSDNLEITGIELDNEVFRIAEGLWSDDNVHLFNADFFEMAQDLPQYDLLISNPPYSRHHHISQDRKIYYSSIVESLSGHSISKLAGAHAYFILAGTSLLKPGGVASWLIPSELFSVNYGKVIREYVTHDVTVERIHFFDSAELQFDDALVSSCVMVIRNKPARQSDFVDLTSGDYNLPSSSIKTTIGHLASINKWQHFSDVSSPAPSACIGDFFYAKRGLSTGSESFFIKSRNDWRDAGISDDYLSPILPPPRYMHEDLILSDKCGWPIEFDNAVLNISIDIDETSLPDAVLKYLNTCPDKVRNCYTIRHRKKWYSIEKRLPAPILCTYMSRSNERPFRFIRNKSQALATNSYLCLYPIDGMSNDDLDKMCSSLNSISPSHLINSGREYGGGLRKLEPRELLSVPFSSPIQPRICKLF